MKSSNQDRRSEELKGLDIDRRKQEARRDGPRRLWLDKAYEEIYISSYVNRIYPRFPTEVHAFSNLVSENELSSVEWSIVEMAKADAEAQRAMRSLPAFANELIQMGLVMNEAGKAIMKLSANPEWDHYLLKTGS